MTILYLTRDLVFGSRVAALAETLARPMVLVASPVDLPGVLAAHPVTLVLIDLGLPLELADVVRQVRAARPAARIVAYGPHVMTGRLAAARETGCDQVVTRGQFQGDLSAILQPRDEVTE